MVASLKNGQVVTRTGINRDVGWSRVEYNGQTLYCVSSYLMAAEAQQKGKKVKNDVDKFPNLC